MRGVPRPLERGTKTRDGVHRRNAARGLRWLALAFGAVLFPSCGEPSSTDGFRPDAMADASGGGSSNASDAGSGDASSGGGFAGGGGGAVPTDASTDTDAGPSTNDAGAGGAAGSGSADDGGAPDATSPSVYAHVVAVSVSGAADSYTYAVSIESADIDCSQYADWWEVLDADGQLVYRHILTHSHTDANGTSDPDAPGNTFTRSGGPVDVTEDAVVVVRAHMSNAGYYGMAMQGSAADGFRAAPAIAPSFAAEVEALDPQPQSCAF